jgi:hypothetical protein
MRHSTAVASPVWANFMPPQRVARSGQVTLQGPGEFEVCARHATYIVAAYIAGAAR